MEPAIEHRCNPRTFAGTDRVFGGKRREHHLPRRCRLEKIIGPDGGRRSVPGFEHDGRAAGAATLQVERASPANVDETGDVATPSVGTSASRKPVSRFGRMLRTARLLAAGGTRGIARRVPSLAVNG